jgi:tetratricopeptide (TPR) repeat protein
VGDWAERYRDGESRLPDEPDERQRQLTRLGNCAWGAGMSELLAGNRAAAVEWLDRACDRYRESYELAAPGSWGRPIAILKARLIAGRDARPDAEWTLAQHPERSESPIAHYAAALALLALGRYEDARPAITPLRDREDFPADVATALAAIAAHDRVAYIEAVEDVLESFEARDAYLEDVPVADTVIVLQTLAARRDLGAELPPSRLLPRSAHL